MEICCWSKQKSWASPPSGLSSSTQHLAPEFSHERKAQRNTLVKERKVNLKDNSQGADFHVCLNPLQWLTCCFCGSLAWTVQTFSVTLEVPLLYVVQRFSQNCAIPLSLNAELNGENDFLYHQQKGSVSFLWEHLPPIPMDPILPQIHNLSRFLKSV